MKPKEADRRRREAREAWIGLVRDKVDKPAQASAQKQGSCLRRLLKGGRI